MAISNDQFAAWLAGDNPRTVLWEQKFGYESGGAAAEGTIYLSDRGYVSAPTDTPASTRYAGAMKAAPTFRRALDKRTLGGRSELSVSDLTIINLDGEFDYLLDLVIDGYEGKCYLGAPAGTPGWSRSDFRLAFSAVAERVVAPNDTEIVVKLRDKRLLLDREVMGITVTGSGPESTHYRPLLWGSHFNIDAKIYEASSNKYAVLSNYAGASTSDVRDNGLTLQDAAVDIYTNPFALIAVDAGTEVFTLSSHGLAVNDVVWFWSRPTTLTPYSTLAPFAGMTAGQQYWVVSVPTADTFTLSLTRGGGSINVTGTTYLGDTGATADGQMRVKRWYDDLNVTGLIQLSASPAGKVTVDVQAVQTYDQSPFAFAKYLIETYGNVAGADIDSAAFTAADTALDAKIALGYTNYSVPTRSNLLNVLDDVVGSAFGWYGVDREGLITCGVVDVSGISGATATRTLGREDLISGYLGIENDQVGAGRINVEYEINHTVQSDGLATSVSDENRRKYSRKYQKVQRSTAPSGTAYSTNKFDYHKTMVEAAPQPAAEMSSFQYGSDTALPIDNYANEIVADMAPHRRFLTALARIDFYDVELGEVVTVTYPRYSLDAGVKARVIGVEVDLTAGKVGLELVCQSTPEIATGSYT